MAQETTDSLDIKYMRVALRMARRGLGRVSPNPTVGCVIVRGGRVVGRGWTQPGGRPHAETEALRRAGNAARGATAYVSLEPCAHHGKTPPCCEALANSGIARVVVACLDPDPRVDGAGLKALERVGVEVVKGVCAAEAKEVNAGFFLRLTKGRPLINLKLATTLDGRIATIYGESQWITGDGARAQGHYLRANHDAILVGSGTIIADDPGLTCRLPGLERGSPDRIIVDGQLSIPLTANVVSSALTTPTRVITLPSADANRRKAMVDGGVEVIEVPPDSAGKPDLQHAMQILGVFGFTRVLVEGGSQIAGALIRQNLIDRVTWFRAPMIIGGDGVPAIAGHGVEALDETVKLRLLQTRRVGPDLMETYVVEDQFGGASAANAITGA